MKTDLISRRARAMLLLAAGMGLCCFAPPAGAGDSRTIFLNKCCSCHRSDGEAQIIWPTDYASFQWKKFFDADRHSRRKDIKGLMTPEESESIKGFLMKHAADSDQPEGIGMIMQPVS